jgi:hypothetical protein
MRRRQHWILDNTWLSITVLIDHGIFEVMDVILVRGWHEDSDI